MKELDEMLARYLRERWPVADSSERAQFERILELPDPQLAAYLLGREGVPDQALGRLLDLLRHDAGQSVAGRAGPAASGS